MSSVFFGRVMVIVGLSVLGFYFFLPNPSWFASSAAFLLATAAPAACLVSE